MSAIAVQSSVDSESFGRRLRRERERRQIALTSIAENSKISVSLFDDLERDEVSRWPSGIYRRAFIRAYAEAVGLDADATAREFLERFPDPHAVDLAITPPPPQPPAALRLTLEDPRRSFTRGRILTSARDRWAAVGWDAAVLMTLGLVMFAVLGTLWVPLCVALVGYYAGGILVLGNTPGVCLCAPRGGTKGPPGGIVVWRRIRAAVALMVPARGPKSRGPARAVAE